MHYCPDVDAVVRRAAEHGARSVDEPQTFHTGDRFAAVVDPFGHRWVGGGGGAGGVRWLPRPRVGGGAEGVAVRNVLGENLFGWEHIRGVSFPDRKSWARLELVDDDYVPLLAIRSNDKEHAARAMERLRELGGRYAPETPHPPR
nr:PH domain-containing protein [Nocardia farcinica]